MEGNELFGMPHGRSNGVMLRFNISIDNFFVYLDGGKKMKNSVRIVATIGIVFLFIVSFVSISMAADTAAAGQKLFMDKKCNTCHSVDSMKITKKLASSKAPDLSNIGAEKNAEWIQKWLKKEVDLNGKKHTPTWGGTPEDLKTLSEWVASLKK
jgi:mono/diheme cytochrome c family protein